MTVRINVAIQSSLRRLGIVRKVKRSQAVAMWEDVVGPAAAKVSKAVTCRDGILFVEVKNSVWATELSLLKRDILKQLNRRLGGGTVKDIRFRATWRSLHEPTEQPGGRKGEGVRRARRQALPAGEVQRIRELASAIKDPALKEVFVRFAITTEETRKLRETV